MARTVRDAAIILDAIAGYDPNDPITSYAVGHIPTSYTPGNYHDDDVPGPDAGVQIQIAGIPDAAKRVLLRHYRIDDTHSNAWSVWKKMGSPQQPTHEQYAALEAAGQLQELESPRWIGASKQIKLDIRLPRQGVSLLQLSW
jgi:xylan 1,4-beta-xylosidase